MCLSGQGDWVSQNYKNHQVPSDAWSCPAWFCGFGDWARLLDARNGNSGNWCLVCILPGSHRVPHGRNQDMCLIRQPNIWNKWDKTDHDWSIHRVAWMIVVAKTTNLRYFHFRHLLKILVLIQTYHKIYWNLLELDWTYFHLMFTYFSIFFETFKGLELMMRRIFFNIFCKSNWI